MCLHHLLAFAIKRESGFSSDIENVLEKFIALFHEGYRTVNNRVTRTHKETSIKETKARREATTNSSHMRRRGWELNLGHRSGRRALIHCANHASYCIILITKPGREVNIPQQHVEARMAPAHTVYLFLSLFVCFFRTGFSILPGTQHTTVSMTRSHTRRGSWIPSSPLTWRSPRLWPVRRSYWLKHHYFRSTAQIMLWHCNMALWMCRRIMGKTYPRREFRFVRLLLLQKANA